MKYTLEIEIDQPREKVAELFGDPGNLVYWQPGFISLEPLSGEDGEAGSKARLLYRHGKRDLEMFETVTVDNLPDEYSATYEARGMHMTVNNHFEEAGPDKTRWITENEAQVSGIMMKLITIVMPGCFKKQSFKYMENFKAFAETGADCREAAA